MALPPAQAPRRAHLYVGNLSPRVTEYMLTEIFAVAGPVQHVKIIPDRNYQHGGLNYGFVEYTDMRSAETALQTLNGRKIFDTEIRVNWAYQGQQNKEDTSGHFHVFVGDLSPEVNDEVLAKAFAAFPSMSDARVMWDMNSGKSRGYGFLAFRDKTDAEQAIATMNGEWLGSRAIRVNWANQKTQGAPGGGGGGMGGGMGGMGMGGGIPGGLPMGMPMGGLSAIPPMPPQRPMGMPQPVGFQGPPMTYDQVVTQSPATNTTVYVGNLVPFATQADLIPLFQSIGYLSEIRMQADRGFAFVKLDTHENAAMAIVQLQGQMIHGRPIKVSWGKDRNAGEGGSQQGGTGGGSPAGGAASPGGAANPYGNMQAMYGMNPNYSQYNFAGYPGFPAMPNVPGQQGAPVAGTPGAPQPGAAPTGDAAAAAAGAAAGAQSGMNAVGQATWGSDPNVFYSQFWGGYYGQPGQQAPTGAANGQNPQPGA